MRMQANGKHATRQQWASGCGQTRHSSAVGIRVRANTPLVSSVTRARTLIPTALILILILILWKYKGKRFGCQCDTREIPEHPHAPSWVVACKRGAPIVRKNSSLLTTFPLFYAILMGNHCIIIGNDVKRSQLGRGIHVSPH